VGHSVGSGIFQQLMVGGWDNSHRVDSCSPEEGIEEDVTSRTQNSMMTLYGYARTRNSMMPGEQGSFPLNS